MLKFYQNKGKDADAAVFSQVSLRRNLRDLPFLSRLDAEKAGKLFADVEKALADAGFSFEKYDFTELSPTKRGLLAEKNLVPQSLVSGAAPRGVFVSGDESVSVIVGDEDHIQILAQDDNQAAVSGTLNTWQDYVITTASGPVEPGSQVRITEN